MAENNTYVSPFEGKTFEERYLAFIDILGFASQVNDNLEGTVEVYEDLIAHYYILGRITPPKLSIYSDSIILQSTSLFDVSYTAAMIQFIALTRNYLARGGIAIGKHLESNQDGNLYVVSQALVKAVKIEKTFKNPCIVLHHEINPIPAAVLNDSARIVINYKGQNIINPFNPRFLQPDTRQIRSQLIQLRNKAPIRAKSKYTWYMNLLDFVANRY